MITLPVFLTWLTGACLTGFDGRRRWVGRASIAALLGSFILHCWMAVRAANGATFQTVLGGWSPQVGIRLRADALTLAFSTATLLILIVAAIHALRDRHKRPYFPAGVLFLATGLQGIFLTGDVFNFYVFFEISIAASFLLIGFHGGTERGISGWSTLVFVLLNLIGSALFVAPVAMIYHASGSLQMETIAQWATSGDPTTALLAAGLIFVAFSIKLALFPFQFWLPDIYRDCSPPIVAILAGALANIGSYGYIRFGNELFASQTHVASGLLMAVGCTSLLYGAWQAVETRTLAGTLAYSSVSQAGYVLVGVAIQTPLGIAAAVLLAISNMLTKTMLFLTLDFGLRGRSVTYVIGAFSIVGIPPTVGFFAKAAIIWAALDRGLLLVVAILVVGSGLAFVYMFRPFPERLYHHRTVEPLSRTGALVVTAALIVGIGIWPDPLLATARHIARTLGGGLP